MLVKTGMIYDMGLKDRGTTVVDYKCCVVGHHFTGLRLIRSIPQHFKQVELNGSRCFHYNNLRHYSVHVYMYMYT